MKNHFPDLARILSRRSSRRRFLKLMGASLGLAGLTACRRQPEGKVIPYGHGKEHAVAGVVDHYATAMEIGAVAVGLLVTAVDGRPIKVEGNPIHPASLGSAGRFAQASILELYDPDRSRSPIFRLDGPEGSQRQSRSWDEFRRFAEGHFARSRVDRGKGLAVISEATSSVSMTAIRARWDQAFPEAAWYEYEPISRDQERAATLWAWNRSLRPHLHLHKARIIVCFSECLLDEHPNAIRHAHDWAENRDAVEHGAMCRLHVVETGYSVTGAMADHRLASRPREIENMVFELARRMEAFQADPSPLPEEQNAFIERLVADLKAHAGRSLVVAGPTLPVETHVLCHRLNEVLGNIGKTIDYLPDPFPNRPHHLEAIKTLASRLEAGEIHTLLLLGGNPAYNAPVDLALGKLLTKVPVTLHLSLFDDETSRLCTWHLPRSHYLESWADGRSWDGTLSVVQPLILPLHDGKSSLELLAMLLNEQEQSGYDIVRRAFRPLLPADTFEKAWQDLLHKGYLDGSAFPPVTNLARRAGSERLLQQRYPLPAVNRIPSRPGAESATGRLEVAFVADRKVHDGRFANNAWLQELPDPLTKLTWDNAACMSPFDASNLNIKSGTVVTLDAQFPSGSHQRIDFPVQVVPGHAEGILSLPLGYGRWSAGQVANGVGENAYTIRVSSNMDVLTDVLLWLPTRTHILACMQDHYAIDLLGYDERRKRERQFAREIKVTEYRLNASGTKVATSTSPATSPASKPSGPAGHQWAMAIDLNKCIGCHACVVACQAENNIPVVGKKEVLKGRAMHWIRVDRYFSGEPLMPHPRVAFQPVFCQHCERAPCESACPVGATTHNAEGLNVMIYSRCAGTRHCSNVCPYKARRFNYFDYHDRWLRQIDSPHGITRSGTATNPAVPLRKGEVMEKCTFCIQRIERARIQAHQGGQKMTIGDILPACAQTCPTGAIVFGDLNDPASVVRRLFEHRRAYILLQELNTRPRLRYLARLRNPLEAEG